MEYFEMHGYLKNCVNYKEDTILLDDYTHLINCDFESLNSSILPGEKEYYCSQHHVKHSDSYNYNNNIGIVNEILDVHDSEVLENRKFRYHIFKPAGKGKAKGIIFMFHGFNEKHWFKYLPWAKRLTEQTGKTLVLFPIAFHMNRAPHEWSDRHLMYEVSEYRRKSFPNILCSTLSNVAISTRLQAKPQRFFWSGLQTFYDVIQLVEQIRFGKHSEISSSATIDIFAYSIGSLLSQILLMNNPKGYFSNTRLCIFCGGAVFNRMSPVSKFIIDSEANVSLYSFVIEHLESHLKKDPRLCHYLMDNHPEGLDFLSMLSYKTMRTVREEKLRTMANRIMAITLDKDTVVPPYEVVNTLQGVGRNIQVKVHSLDFPYDYKHEDPFPAVASGSERVNESFNEVFDLASAFLK
ncbi:MAG: hypothetical protein HC905_13360 [Bacteroidales bacterium]|nr:hypothetical protein [Bacteroidales bacterium]